MKKIFLFMLIIMVVSANLFSVSAANWSSGTAGATPKMEINITEGANIVTATFTIHGTPADLRLSGFTAQLFFNKDKVTLLKSDKKTVQNASVLAANIPNVGALANYVELPTFITNSWAKNPSSITIGATSFIQFGANTATWADKQEIATSLVVAKVYFKNISDAKIDTSCFWFNDAMTTPSVGYSGESSGTLTLDLKNTKTNFGMAINGYNGSVRIPGLPGDDVTIIDDDTAVTVSGTANPLGAGACGVKLKNVGNTIDKFLPAYEGDYDHTAGTGTYDILKNGKFTVILKGIASQALLAPGTYSVQPVSYDGTTYTDVGEAFTFTK